MRSHQGMKFPITIIVGFQEKDKQNSQNLNNETICRLSVTNAQCIIETEKYPDAGIIVYFDNNDFPQGNGRNKKLL